MPQAKVLMPAEIKRILAVISSGRNSHRNRIAFLLSLYAGMRVGEIAALRLKDVYWPNGDVVREIWLAKNQTKGNSGRTVYVSDRLARELTEYHKTLRDSDLDCPLIPSKRRGRHFTATTLCMLLSSIYRAAGVRTTSHSGRRTFATRLNEQGVGMRTIQKLMGHKHIGTTAIYCEVSDAILHRAINFV